MGQVKTEWSDEKNFEYWKNEWSRINNLPLEIHQKTILDTEEEEETGFIVTKRSTINIDDTFLIALKPMHKVPFSSGDLVAITPEGTHKKRLYSIAKIDEEIANEGKPKTSEPINFKPNYYKRHNL